VRKGFLLVDAVIGMFLLAVLLTGLHQLRGVQMRGARVARARLGAAETAASAALLAGLDAHADRKALLTRLRPASSAGPLELTTAPLANGLTRVTARAPWRAGPQSGVEEVSGFAP
jgi:hypothetical protein